MRTRVNSRSDAQKAAERAALEAASRELGVILSSRRLHLSGRIFDVDGYAQADQRIVLTEVWAHVGVAKSAQRHKVMADLLKLALITRLLATELPSYRVEPYLVFVDTSAAQVVLNKSWGALAAREFGVQPLLVDIAPTLIAAVREAQQLQDLRGEAMLPSAE